MNAEAPLVGIPRFELSSGNSEIDPRLVADVDTIELKEDVGMPAMLSFTVDLWDMVNQQLDEERLAQFALGTPLELALGLDEASPVFTGEVAALAPEFGGLEQGDSFRVEAYNRLHRLQFGTHQRTFEKMASSEIASTLADEVGLTGEVDDSGVKHAHVTQNNVSNLRFLRQLAKSINYEIMVEDQTLYFRQSQEAQGASLTLNYRRELVRFMPRQRALTQGEMVEVRGWDVKNKESILGTAGPGDEISTMAGQQSGAEISSAAFESATRTITNHALADNDEATQIAQARFNFQQRDFIEAEGQCVGTPQLRAGKTIEILGIGETFSGIYYVTSVTHSIGAEGYRSRFKARRNAA